MSKPSILPVTEIVPMSNRHLNWVRSSFKTTFRKACYNIADTELYYRAANPFIDGITSEYSGIVAAYKHDQNEYLGWILYTDDKKLVYAYTTKDMRNRGVCNMLLLYANISYGDDTAFRTRDWQSIIAHKKEQSLRSISDASNGAPPQ